MIQFDRFLRATPLALLGLQFLLVGSFLGWLAASGALPLWAGAALCLVWFFRTRRATPAFRKVTRDLAALQNKEYPVACRHIARISRVLAHRAGIAAPMILPRSRGADHNLAAMPGENLLLVNRPVLEVVTSGALPAGPLAGLLAHEVAHLAQDRRWHHLYRPLRATALTAGLLAGLVMLLRVQAGLGPVGLLLVSVLIVLGAVDRLIGQALELRADALAVDLIGDDQDMRLGMALLTVFDAVAFDPLPRHMAPRFARDLQAFGADLGERMQVSGQPLEVLAARVLSAAAPYRPSLWSRFGSLLVGEWPASHPSPARRLALLASMSQD